MDTSKISFLLIWLSCFLLTSHAKLVTKKLTVTWELGAPNGQARPMIKVNGGFPAPPLVFDEDDDVQVCCKSSSIYNAISLINLIHTDNRTQSNASKHDHALAWFRVSSDFPSYSRYAAQADLFQYGWDSLVGWCSWALPGSH